MFLYICIAQFLNLYINTYYDKYRLLSEDVTSMLQRNYAFSRNFLDPIYNMYSTPGIIGLRIYIKNFSRVTFPSIMLHSL